MSWGIDNVKSLENQELDYEKVKAEFGNYLPEELGYAAIILCETIECKNCPITTQNYEKRTVFEKEVIHIPCHDNLYKWLLDQAKAESERK